MPFWVQILHTSSCWYPDEADFAPSLDEILGIEREEYIWQLVNIFWQDDCFDFETGMLPIPGVASCNLLVAPDLGDGAMRADTGFHIDVFFVSGAAVLDLIEVDDELVLQAGWLLWSLCLSAIHLRQAGRVRRVISQHFIPWIGYSREAHSS